MEQETPLHLCRDADGELWLLQGPIEYKAGKWDLTVDGYRAHVEEEPGLSPWNIVPRRVALRLHASI